MLNYSVSISLGTGDKGKEWDRIIRQQSKRARMSVGAYIRLCVYEKIKREQEASGEKMKEVPAGGATPQTVEVAPEEAV